MIEFRFNHDKHIFLEYAELLGDTRVMSIVERGVVADVGDAEALADFYWRMVKASVGDDIESTLEHVLTTVSVALDDAGFGEVWDEAVSRA